VTIKLAVLSVVPVFRRNIPPQSSGSKSKKPGEAGRKLEVSRLVYVCALEMDAMCSFETSISLRIQGRTTETTVTFRLRVLRGVSGPERDEVTGRVA
jgi:hypothetical protein